MNCEPVEELDAFENRQECDFCTKTATYRYRCYYSCDEHRFHLYFRAFDDLCAEIREQEEETSDGSNRSI